MIESYLIINSKSLTTLSKSNVHFLAVQSLYYYLNRVYHYNQQLLKIVLLSDLTHTMTSTGNSSYAAHEVMPIVYDILTNIIYQREITIID